MAIGVVVLAHQHLHRVRQLARRLSSGTVKVAIHIDARTDSVAYAKLVTDFRKNPNVLFVPRRRCNWGRFSMLRAGICSAELLLAKWPDLSHVLQISGDCLPLRPIRELEAFLDQRPDTDFTESVPAAPGAWVVDGLSDERFSLYHPFSWKSQRRLFDASVALQRRIGVKRRPPHGLVPHLGSQWWCLSAQTLRAILNDPDRTSIDRYFRTTWIPDEGYIPTLVRRHSQNLTPISLTLMRFDASGRPFVFHDDHADLLMQSDSFFVRKVWHGADGLYRKFLASHKEPRNRRIDADLGIDVRFETAIEQQRNGRQGLLNVGRFPQTAAQNRPETCRDYSVFIGFQHLFQNFSSWLELTTGTLAHQRLYQADRVNFALGLDTIAAGSLSANPQIRDLSPEQFLTNLIWNQRNRHQSFLLEYADQRRMISYVIDDPNAQLYILRGSWILDLFQRGNPDQDVLLRQAHRLSAIEQKMMEDVAGIDRSEVMTLGFANTIRNCATAMSLIQDRVRPELSLRPAVPLHLRQLSGLRRFVAMLEHNGVDISTFGPLPDPLPGEIGWLASNRIMATG